MYSLYGCMYSGKLYSLCRIVRYLKSKFSANFWLHTCGIGL